MNNKLTKWWLDENDEGNMKTTVERHASLRGGKL